MSNTTRIERRGITALERVLQDSCLIKSDIDKNDKTESWDGFIYLYSNPDWKKSALVGRIPVQIKSTEHLIESDTTSIPISIADLRNYCIEGGVILFLISLDADTDTNHIFYASLLKECVSRILNTKYNQKEIVIKLQTFPKAQPDKMEQIFYSFLNKRSVPANLRDRQTQMQLVDECRSTLNECNIISESDDPMIYLDKDLKKYILQKFKWYKEQNIAVQTPQLLLMLLTYPNDSIIKSIFNIYKTEDGNPYGAYLVQFFQDVDSQYKSTKRLYREQNWISFLRLLTNAKKVLHDQKDKTRITINILCYTILCYSGGGTVEMIRGQMGKEEFERITQFILNDVLPSVPVDPHLSPYVVRCW